MKSNPGTKTGQQCPSWSAYGGVLEVSQLLIQYKACRPNQPWKRVSIWFHSFLVGAAHILTRHICKEASTNYTACLPWTWLKHKCDLEITSKKCLDLWRLGICSSLPNYTFKKDISVHLRLFLPLTLTHNNSNYHVVCCKKLTLSCQSGGFNNVTM